MRDVDIMNDEIENARQRLGRHRDLEAQRVEAGIETDLERYLNGVRYRD